MVSLRDIKRKQKYSNTVILHYDAGSHYAYKSRNRDILVLGNEPVRIPYLNHTRLAHRSFNVGDAFLPKFQSRWAYARVNTKQHFI